jgi:hypothetical protein
MNLPIKPALTPEDAQRWLSAERFKVYDKTGKVEDALDLYDWNSRLTAACARDVGHLELCLRNAYDKQIVAKHGEWTDPNNDFHNLESGISTTKVQQQNLNDESWRQVSDAYDKSATHGHVVANLTFGFWFSLTDSRRADTHWNNTLYKAFPKGTSRGTVHDLVKDLVRFRNRLSHWEPVFSRTTALQRSIRQVDELFQLLDPAVARWVGSKSTLPAAVASPPRAGLTGTPGRIIYLGRNIGL